MEDYTKGNQWSSNKKEKCKDPIKLYETVLPKFHSWFKEVDFEFFNVANSTTIEATKTKMWIPIDWNARQRSSRCYKLNLTLLDHPPWTIKFAKFWFRKEGSVIVHGPGQFQVKDPKELTQAKLTVLDSALAYKVVYEELTMLNGKDGKACNESLEYSFEQCVLDEIEKVSFKSKEQYFCYFLLF